MGQELTAQSRGGQTWILPQAVVGLEAEMSAKDTEQQELAAELDRVHPCLGARLKGQVLPWHHEATHPAQETLFPQRTLGPHTCSLSTSSAANG